MLSLLLALKHPNRIGVIGHVQVQDAVTATFMGRVRKTRIEMAFQAQMTSYYYNEEDLKATGHLYYGTANLSRRLTPASSISIPIIQKVLFNSQFICFF